ncbi:pseudouridine synthase [Flavobacteriaceae bacterium 14752]|uniref:pseudouridine synthase n=1 Tax=Mesohalobacter salilacus TaxID=2491711 RepID=UPI000F634FB8|nr:pseudouridine synthase [Flavobacteriaceae bacterium 14752]
MHFHYKLYKPSGYLSQFINNQLRRKNKKLLGELYDFRPETMPIGRLDQNSEGLLLLTTNGKLSYKILKGDTEKEYWVQVNGEITEEAIKAIQSGLNISINGKPYKTKPCQAYKIKTPDLPEPQHPIKPQGGNTTSWLSVTLTEGKFRQVRKMTAKVGFPTLRLVRVRIGQERIDQLKPGEVAVSEEFKL